jgi:hypothetical protein
VHTRLDVVGVVVRLFAPARVHLCTPTGRRCTHHHCYYYYSYDHHNHLCLLLRVRFVGGCPCCVAGAHCRMCEPTLTPPPLVHFACSFACSVVGSLALAGSHCSQASS